MEKELDEIKTKVAELVAKYNLTYIEIRTKSIGYVMGEGTSCKVEAEIKY